MKETFLTVQQLLSSIASISWVDKDKGQLDRYDGKPPIPDKTALIKVSINSTQQVSDTSQLCRVTITIRLYFDLQVSETSHKAPDEARMRSLEYFDVEKEVFNKLQGYSDEHLDTIKRQSSVEEDRRDGLTVCKMMYTSSYYESVDAN